MKQKVLHLIILDESYTMKCIETQTIEGVNETINNIRETQRTHDTQEHFLTFISFNSESIRTIYDNVEVYKIEEFTRQQYHPNYNERLYDSVGNILIDFRKKIAEDDTVLVTIITHGMDHVSEEYNCYTLKLLIETLKTKGWGFKYIIKANQNEETFMAALSKIKSPKISYLYNKQGNYIMFFNGIKIRILFLQRLIEYIYSPHKSFYDLLSLLSDPDDPEYNYEDE